METCDHLEQHFHRQCILHHLHFTYIAWQIHQEPSSMLNNLCFSDSVLQNGVRRNTKE